MWDNITIIAAQGQGADGDTPVGDDLRSPGTGPGRKAAGIKQIRFDRGRYNYHGRVAEIASAAREGGLNF